MKGAARGTSYRIPWDAEEVAVLVHGYMQLKNSVLFYNEAIKYVSHPLRERALRRGMNVGETFRNENGISMQMAKIEDIFSGGKFRLSPPPQVFFDVVQLYRKDRKAFNELFERATGASSDRAALEKDFFQWLANKIPPHILPDLQDACHNLNNFLSEYKVLDISLFDKNIIHVMDKVKSTVNSNEILHFLQQEKMSLMQTAIEFYYIYLIEAHDNDASHQPIGSPMRASRHRPLHHLLPTNRRRLSPRAQRYGLTPRPRHQPQHSPSQVMHRRFICSRTISLCQEPHWCSAFSTAAVLRMPMPQAVRIQKGECTDTHAMTSLGLSRRRR